MFLAKETPETCGKGRAVAGDQPVPLKMSRRRLTLVFRYLPKQTAHINVDSGMTAGWVSDGCCTVYAVIAVQRSLTIASRLEKLPLFFGTKLQYRFYIGRPTHLLVGEAGGEKKKKTLEGGSKQGGTAFGNLRGWPQLRLQAKCHI